MITISSQRTTMLQTILQKDVAEAYVDIKENMA